MKKLLGPAASHSLLVLIALAPSALAGGITATFDTSLTSSTNALQAETAITNAVNTVNGLYTLSGTLPVLFQYNAGLGGGAQTNSAIFQVAYVTYRAKLVADASAHPSNSTLATATGSLPSTLTQTMTVSAVFANQILGQSLSLCYNSSGAFVSSCGQQYAAVVQVSAPSTVGNYYTSPGAGYNSQAVTAAEHELDEVLGGGGMGSTLKSTSTGTPTSYGPTDLYRYNSTSSGCATGVTTAFSWTASSSSTACYSINGGSSAIKDASGNAIQFNQTGSGDYGDFAASGSNIQNASVPGGNVSNYSSASPEAIMMQSIGYNLTTQSTPEPATWSLFAAAFGAGFVFRKKTRRLR